MSHTSDNATSNKRAIFDLFDNNSITTNSTTTTTIATTTYNNQETTITNRYPLDMGSVESKDLLVKLRDDNELSDNDIFTTNSSSSISSLFDLPSSLYSRQQLYTTTVTPILSRNDSMKFKHMTPALQLLTSPDEFTSKLDSKLKQQQQKQQQQQQQQWQQWQQRQQQAELAKSKSIPTQHFHRHCHATKLVVLLVGLPASGKSTICNQFKNYIGETTSYRSEIYNAGDVRRRKSFGVFNDSTFFDPKNNQARQDRELYATITLNHLISDMTNDIVDIGFLDATNTTQERRNRMLESVHSAQTGYKLRTMILDVQCTDTNLINYNIVKGKVNNQDYQNKSNQLAISDFKRRLNHYKTVYEPVTWQELDDYEQRDMIQIYVKCINAGESFEVNKTKFVEEELEREEEMSEAEKSEEDLDKWYIDIIDEFRSKYNDLEGKKYHENVERWVNSEEHMIKEDEREE
ncbi:hypothetical protein KGF56_000332 [Candida oxycetoniae]|uniref:6-phosphofructo-2-kinase domain-containing protein n=1 Tax=Candida oxycetoniae TaxID=497107 RepID=A0AAI9WZU1_9ASCO|nr:uncharacterized protein KGF56_000332 [Candida oxycetoniae]KAI3406727.2 hypothetical protein KGF56_000332 [Candida oxycetoniae]